MGTSAIRDDNGLYNFARIGIPSEPMVFLRKAIKLNPTLQSGLISEAMLEAFEINADSLRLRKVRLQNFAMMVSKAKALESDESTLHSAMPVHLKMVLRGKRTLLFEQLLQHISYPDDATAGRFEQVFHFMGGCRCPMFSQAA